MLSVVLEFKTLRMQEYSCGGSSSCKKQVLTFPPVDLGVMNRPIRFKLTARTDDPKILRTMQIHRSSPIINKRKVFGVQQRQT